MAEDQCRQDLAPSIARRKEGCLVRRQDCVRHQVPAWSGGQAEAGAQPVHLADQQRRPQPASRHRAAEHQQWYLRVHRSYIVNLDFVQAITPMESGDARAMLSTGGEVPVSRCYRDGLKSSC
ncbi:LytTR family transcriptional regulator [Janthinobacterium lividum]|nr:LytTR family transcriptional regulator [Janthinobacterium lividum]